MIFIGEWERNAFDENLNTYGSKEKIFFVSSCYCTANSFYEIIYYIFTKVTHFNGHGALFQDYLAVTVCLRSSYLIYIVSYCIKCKTTSWTYSTRYLTLG